MSLKIEALLVALCDLFGPRLSFGEVEEGDEEVVILWDGQVDSVVGLAEGGPESVAWPLLSAAQDIWSRGLGESGVHPGLWATASPSVSLEGATLRLTLGTPDGGRAEVTVPAPQP